MGEWNCHLEIFSRPYNVNERKFQAIFAFPNRYFRENRCQVLLRSANTIFTVLFLRFLSEIIHHNNVSLINQGPWCSFQIAGGRSISFEVLLGGVGLWTSRMVYLVPTQYFLNTVTTHQSFFFNSLTNQKGVSNKKV